jgi:DNA-binding NarL/FixJ family response regulator
MNILLSLEEICVLRLFMSGMKPLEIGAAVGSSSREVNETLLQIYRKLLLNKPVSTFSYPNHRADRPDETISVAAVSCAGPTQYGSH